MAAKSGAADVDTNDSNITGSGGGGGGGKSSYIIGLIYLDRSVLDA